MAIIQHTCLVCCTPGVGAGSGSGSGSGAVGGVTLVTTACCNTMVPSVLFATITSSCACLNGVVVTLNFLGPGSSGFGLWRGEQDNVCDNCQVHVDFSCERPSSGCSGMQSILAITGCLSNPAQIACVNTIPQFPVAGCTCSPLFVRFPPVVFLPSNVCLAWQCVGVRDTYLTITA